MSITIRKLGRAIHAGCPQWLVAMWIVFAFIPLDPFDEIVPATITLVVLIVQPHRIPRARSAWRGGKSHRAADAALGQIGGEPIWNIA